jgi:hypothetical protein
VRTFRSSRGQAGFPHFEQVLDDDLQRREVFVELKLFLPLRLVDEAFGVLRKC